MKSPALQIEYQVEFNIKPSKQKQKRAAPPIFLPHDEEDPAPPKVEVVVAVGVLDDEVEHDLSDVHYWSDDEGYSPSGDEVEEIAAEDLDDVGEFADDAPIEEPTQEEQNEDAELEVPRSALDIAPVGVQREIIEHPIDKVQFGFRETKEYCVNSFATKN